HTRTRFRPHLRPCSCRNRKASSPRPSSCHFRRRTLAASSFRRPHRCPSFPRFRILPHPFPSSLHFRIRCHLPSCPCLHRHRPSSHIRFRSSRPSRCRTIPFPFRPYLSRAFHRLPHLLRRVLHHLFHSSSA